MDHLMVAEEKIEVAQVDQSTMMMVWDSEVEVDEAEVEEVIEVGEVIEVVEMMEEAIEAVVMMEDHQWMEDESMKMKICLLYQVLVEEEVKEDEEDSEVEVNTGVEGTSIDKWTKKVVEAEEAEEVVIEVNLIVVIVVEVEEEETLNVVEVEEEETLNVVEVEEEVVKMVVEDVVVDITFTINKQEVKGMIKEEEEVKKKEVTRSE